MSNNQRFNGKRSTVVLAARDSKAQEILGGKTLNEIGYAHQLTDSDVSIVMSTNPKTAERIASLRIVVGGTPYVVPFARNFPMDKIQDVNWFLDCQFRVRHLSVKNDDGTPKEIDGQVVLDETQAYLSFGKPDGIVFDEVLPAFAELSETEQAAAAAGMKTP